MELIDLLSNTDIRDGIEMLENLDDDKFIIEQGMNELIINNQNKCSTTNGIEREINTR